MNRSSPEDAKILDRFLRIQTQHSRCPQTVVIYRYVLREFQCFVAAHSAGAPPSLPLSNRGSKRASSNRLCPSFANGPDWLNASWNG